MKDTDTTAGIEGLLQLFLCHKKSELKKLCRITTVTKAALADFIVGSISGVTPWAHQRHHREFVPSHLIPSTDGGVSLTADGRFTSAAQKFMRKISSIFDQRRLLSGHLFFSSDLSNWHLLYFDQRDMARHDNHWDGGSHIHLINHLWPNWTADSIWNEFRTGNPQMKGAYHVRFIDSRD
ncbi:MAG TPA: hypothetical protein VMH84_05020 [Xanthobacteraceae bacterium]|nr:hypothetical protein [Xanthobacteraceae bacterium]